MDVVVPLVALLVMLVGLVGAVVPVLPGLVLVWAAGVASLLWQGADPVGWALAAVLTLLLALGTLATLVLPARRGRRGGVSSATLGVVVVGAVVGAVVLPVMGLPVGALVGLYVGERRRLGEHEPAWRATVAVLRAYGTGVLVELLLGVTMIAVWGVAIVARG